MSKQNKKLTNYLNYLINHLKQTLVSTEKKGYVLGISCGIDSVLALRILIDAVPSNQIYAFFIDIESKKDEQYLEIVQEYFEQFNVKITTLEFSQVYDNLKNTFKISNEVNANNLKPKIRSMFLYATAFANNALVLNTTNYDEYILGYFTKFGDSNGDVFLLNGLLKTHIYQLAELYQIPQEIINRTPDAGLAGLNDEQEFGFSYHQLDQWLLNKKIPEEVVKKIQQRIAFNQHKQWLIKPKLLKRIMKFKK